MVKYDKNTKVRDFPQITVRLVVILVKKVLESPKIQ